MSIQVGSLACDPADQREDLQQVRGKKVRHAQVTARGRPAKDGQSRGVRPHAAHPAAAAIDDAGCQRRGGGQCHDAADDETQHRTQPQTCAARTSTPDANAPMRSHQRGA